MSCDYITLDLDAYVDRELDAASAAAIRDHASGCDECRARLAERESLGRLLRSAPYYTAPARLRANVPRQSGRAFPARSLLAVAAAAVLIISAAGAVALLRSTSGRASTMADEAANAHVRSLMAQHLFDVRSTDQHTVKPWFLGKLDFSPPVTDLASIGFPLTGGRLDYVGGRPVAALVYQRRQHTINVFVAPADGSSPRTEARSIRGFHVRHWIAGGMSYWAVSDLNDAELTEFTRALGSS